MTNPAVELSDVVYNAATQCFEARVTVHAGADTTSYACAIDAPISMTFADAASGLATQALRRHRDARGLRARRCLPRLPGRRAARTRSGFDPFAMLRKLAA